MKGRPCRRLACFSAFSHAVAVTLVLAAALALGAVLDTSMLTRLAAIALIGWALWHAARGHRMRVRVGMQTGLGGLALWSFLMASAHGAGLMLVHVVMPICLAASPGPDVTGSLALAAAAVGVDTAAMLATIGAIALIVYRLVGVAFLRRGWINLDLVWTLALLLCGVALLVV
jgi:hypothetical protein